MKPGYNYKAPNSVHALSKETKKLPAYEPDLDYFILHNQAKPTYLLSVTPVSGGFMVSEKLKQILEQFTLPLHKFYPAKVLHKNNNNLFMVIILYCAILALKRVITQAQIAQLVNMHRSNYSKVEAGERELSVTALAKVAKYFGMTLDELVNFKGKLPAEEKIEDKATIEQLKLINELDPEDKAMVFRMIDTVITKKKFKDFVATMQ